ncbi:hypothetical protein [Helicobacter typhlonius]|uniref:hypothetical protein n=2 Tax=Helicobacteraceae TaxID=72293 RepID=UPI002FDFD8FC
MKKIMISLSVTIMVLVLSGCGSSGFKCDSTESKNLLEEYIKQQADKVFKSPEKLKEIPVAFQNIQLIEKSKDELNLECTATAQVGSRSLDLQYIIAHIKNADGSEAIALKHVKSKK